MYVFVCVLVSMCVLLVGELRHQAAELGVPVSVLSVRMVLDRVQQLTSSALEGEKKHALLNTTQRVSAWDSPTWKQ